MYAVILALALALSSRVSWSTPSVEALRQLRGLAHDTIARQMNFAPEPLLSANARALEHLHQQTINVLMLTEARDPSHDFLVEAVHVLNAPIDPAADADTLPAAEQLLFRTIFYSYLLGQHLLDPRMKEEERRIFQSVTVAVHGLMVGIVQHRGTVPAMREKLKAMHQHVISVVNTASRTITDPSLRKRLDRTRAATTEALNASNAADEFAAILPAFHATDLAQDCETALAYAAP